MGGKIIRGTTFIEDIQIIGGKVDIERSKIIEESHIVERLNQNGEWNLTKDIAGLSSIEDIGETDFIGTKIENIEGKEIFEDLEHAICIDKSKMFFKYKNRNKSCAEVKTGRSKDTIDIPKQQTRKSNAPAVSGKKKGAKKKQTTHKKLKIGYLNLNGRLKKCVDELENLVNTENIDIMAAVETHSYEGQKEISMEGYSCLSTRRRFDEKKGGGIAVWSRLEIPTHTPNTNIIVEKEDTFKIRIESERLWQICKIGAFKIALCTVYFAVDKGENEDFNDNLCETIIDEGNHHKSNGCNLLLLGDFNGHIGAGPDGIEGSQELNNNGRRIFRICECLNLEIANKFRCCKGKWTWGRGTDKSIIDFALVDSTIKSKLKFMEIEEGEKSVGSDHSFIWLELDLVTFRKKQSSPKEVWKLDKKPNWESFNCELRDILRDFNQVVVEYDKGEKDISDVCEYVITGVSEAGKKTIGTKKVGGNKRRLPADLYKLVRERNDLEKKWKKARKNSEENTKDLFDRYKEARIKVGLKKKELNSIQNMRLSDKIKLEGGASSAEFWRNVNAKENNHITVIEDDEGVQYTQEEEIAEVTRDFFAKLNQKIESDRDIQSQTKDCGSQNTQNQIGISDTEKCDTSCIGEVQLSELKRVLKKCKNKKSAGSDKIPVEFFKNMNDGNLDILRKLISLVIIRQDVPAQWKEDRLILLYKGKGGKEKLDNYRGISIGNSLGKIFSKILCNRLTKVVEDRDLLGEVQNAFRRDRRGTDSLFILTQAIEYLKMKKQKGYFAFIDLKKAFDTVWREGLWTGLENLGIGVDTIRLLQNMYVDTRKRVEINGVVTEWFPSEQGLRQGCVLSPLLFALYIRNLAEELIDDNKGIDIGGIKIPCLFFADDMVLMTKTESDLKAQLEILSDFCERKRLVINYEKTKIMTFRDNSKTSLQVSLGGAIREIEIVDSFKYLGVEICNGRNIYKAYDKTVVQKIKRIAGVSKLKARESFDPVEVAEILWKYVGINGGLYGVEIGIITEETLKKLESVQNEMASWIIGADRGTAVEALRGELGWHSLRKIIYERKLKYLERVKNLPVSNWTFQVYSNLVINDIDTKWRRDLRNITGKISGDNNNIEEWSIDCWKKGVRDKGSLVMYAAEWQGHKKDYIDQSSGSKDFFRTISGTLVKKYMREYRVCSCGLEKPDEFHILVECGHLAGARDGLDLDRHLRDQGIVGNMRLSRAEFGVGLLNCRHKVLLGELFGELNNKWKSVLSEGRVLACGLTTTPLPVCAPSVQLGRLTN